MKENWGTILVAESYASKEHTAIHISFFTRPNVRKANPIDMLMVSRPNSLHNGTTKAFEKNSAAPGVLLIR